MPNSPHDSIASPAPSAPLAPRDRRAALSGDAARGQWRRNAALFVATVASTFVTWWFLDGSDPSVRPVHALEYTGALMTILLAHEFGHFFAARIHRVDASLPYFLPLPFISPFGTMGAVIRMRSVIPTRRALLDIGAAGPLSGLVVALPIYAWGVAHSEVISLSPSGGASGGSIQLGSSLLLSWMDLHFGPHVPEGSDILLSPVAYAAWAGMFVTMINLLPLGQLDGGHVAYAWLGKRYNRIAPWVHRSLLAFFFVSLGGFIARDLSAGVGLWRFGQRVEQTLFWLVWFEVLAILGTWTQSTSRAPRRSASKGLRVSTRVVATLGLVTVAGALEHSTSIALWAMWLLGLATLIVMESRWGALRGESDLLSHPETDPKPIDGARVAVAALTLGFFALLFMPTPMGP